MYGSFKSNQLCSQSLLDTGHVCTDQCFDAGTKTIGMSKPGLVHLQPLSSPTSATPPSLQENLLFPFSDSTSHRSRTNSSRMELEESSKSWVTTSQTSTLPGFSETGSPVSRLCRGPWLQHCYNGELKYTYGPI